jgi:hypothetical protein
VTPSPTMPLYARVMGDSWLQIAEAVRVVHSTSPITRTRGQLRVQHGPRYLGRLLARLLRLPSAGPATDTTLLVTAADDGERWQRMVGECRFETQQYASSGLRLAERYGALEFLFRLRASGGSLVYVQDGAALLFRTRRLRLPHFVAPQIEAREDPVSATSVDVTVSVRLPGVGLVIAYNGTMAIDETPT